MKSITISWPGNDNLHPWQPEKKWKMLPSILHHHGQLFCGKHHHQMSKTQFWKKHKMSQGIVLYKVFLKPILKELIFDWWLTNWLQKTGYARKGWWLFCLKTRVMKGAYVYVCGTYKNNSPLYYFYENMTYY